MKFQKLIALLTAAALAAAVFTGCGNSAVSSSEPSSAASSEVSSEVSSEPSTAPESSEATDPIPDVAMNVAGLKGPTGLGMLKMMEDSDAAESTPYTFTLAGAADEVVSKITTGELDIASVPSNLAATLWNKTNGGVQVLGINALGVLYLVTKGRNRQLPRRPEGQDHHLQRQGHHCSVHRGISAEGKRHRPGDRRDHRL